MSIMIKLFLLAYLLAMVLLSILGVISILTVIFTPEWLTKRELLMIYQKNKGDEINLCTIFNVRFCGIDRNHYPLPPVAQRGHFSFVGRGHYCFGLT